MYFIELQIIFPSGRLLSSPTGADGMRARRVVHTRQKQI